MQKGFRNMALYSVWNLDDFPCYCLLNATVLPIRFLEKAMLWGYKPKKCPQDEHQIHFLSKMLLELVHIIMSWS